MAVGTETKEIRLILNAIDNTKAAFTKTNAGMIQVNQRMRKMQQVSMGANVNMDRLRGTLNQVNIGMNKQGQFIDTVNGGLMQQREVIGRVSRASQRFRMELLSIMFFGMAIQQTFAGLTQRSFETMGTFEVFGAGLELAFLPVAQDVAEVMNDIGFALMDLPEGTQKTIGWIAILGQAFGATIGAIGMFGLGIVGIKAWLGPAGVVASRFAGSILLVGAAFVFMRDVYATHVEPTFDKIENMLDSSSSKTDDFVSKFISSGRVFISQATGLGEGYTAGLAPLGDVAPIVAVITSAVKDQMETTSSSVEQINAWGDSLVKSKEKTSAAEDTLGEFNTTLEDVYDSWGISKEEIEKNTSALEPYTKMIDESSLKSVALSGKLDDEVIPSIILFDDSVSTAAKNLNTLISSMNTYNNTQMATKTIKIIEQRETTSFGFFEGLGGAISGLKERILGSRQFGGYIPETGLYNLHAGETVIPSTNVGGVNITVNVSGSERGMDERMLAEKIGEVVTAQLRNVTIR